MPTPAEARALFRAFLRAASKFPNYNIREYVRRRACESFRAAEGVSDAVQLEALWARARQELEVAQRQAAVYELYHRPLPSIMELEEGHKFKPH